MPGLTEMVKILPDVTSPFKYVWLLCLFIHFFVVFKVLHHRPLQVRLLWNSKKKLNNDILFT